MKTLSASIFAILLSAAAPLCLQAEEPTSAFGLTPPKPDSLLPEGQNGLPLIPNSLPTPEKSKQAPEQQTKTSVAEDALRDLIKLRVARTKAQSDPGLQALWDSSYKARTDAEQREILTKYYNQLCDRIVKIDKTLKPEVVEALRSKWVGNFQQNRITRTPATPAPAATTAPAPTPAATATATETKPGAGNQ